VGTTFFFLIDFWEAEFRNALLIVIQIEIINKKKLN